MNRQRTAAWYGLLCIAIGGAALLHCGGDDTSVDAGGIDAGNDAADASAADASADSAADAGGDSGRDAGGDSAADAGGDSGMDATADSGADTGADTGADAANDAAVDSSAACGAFLQACCSTGAQCADVTLSCDGTSSTCVHTLNVGYNGVYTINGMSAPALTLKSGTPYTLKFANPSVHPFVLTTSATGGTTVGELTPVDVPGYIPGGACASGCTSSMMTITPDVNAKSSFFYQCEVHAGLGNSVTVTP